MSDRARSFRQLGIEFAVIVLGVLIALAVDRAVQGVDEGALERSYLASLLRDFQNGADDAEYAAEFVGRRMAMIETLIHTIETGTAPDSTTAVDLARAIELSGWHPGVTFPRATWEDLVNTGRLGLITNEQLRRSVADFYIELDWFRELDGNWRRWMEPVQEEPGYILSPAQRLAITRGVMSTSPPPLDPPPLTDLVAGLTERPETLRHLGQALVVAELAGGTISSTAASARDIVAQLEEELSR